MSNIVQIPLKMPPDLAAQVNLLNLPPNPAFAEFGPLEPAHCPAAAEWLRRKRELIKQASRKQCHAWFVGIVQGINGVTEPQAVGREAAIWSMCCDLPDLVWCEATMQAMWARTTFLPSPGECREVLSAHAAPLLAEIAALERIAAVPAPKRVEVAPPYQPPHAPEWTKSRAVPGRGTGGDEIGSLAAAVRRVEQQLAARKKPDDPPEPPDAAA